MSRSTHRPHKQHQFVLILGATYATGNMGVDALLSGTIASIRHNAPNAKIAVLDYGFIPSKWTISFAAGNRDITRLNLRFSWKLWLRNNGFRLLALAMLIRMIPSRVLRDKFIARNPRLSLLRNASVALSLAGGDSFSDIYGFRRLIYVSLPQLLVLAMGRPLVLLPQTLGPFKARWAKWIGSLIMKRARQVFSRDKASLVMARELLGVDSELLYLSHDMGFALAPIAPVDIPEWARQKNRPLIGLNVSGLLYMGGYNQSNMFGIHGNYPNLIRKIVQWFTNSEETDVVLVTHVTGEQEGDEKACSAIFEDLKDKCHGRLHLANPEYNHREIKYLIGKCDFFIGSRMHACVAALSQEVPAVGLAYSRKFAGVFETVRVEDLVVDLRDLNENEVFERVVTLYGIREKFVKLMWHTIPPARKAAMNLLTRIADSDAIDVGSTVGADAASVLF